MIFESIEVYGNNSIVGITGNTYFNSLDKAIDYFNKLSDSLNDCYNSIYLSLK